MQRLEVSGAVWPLYGSLGVKGLTTNDDHVISFVTKFLYDAVCVSIEYVLILDHAWFSDLYFWFCPKVVCVMKNML